METQLEFPKAEESGGRRGLRSTGTPVLLAGFVFVGAQLVLFMALPHPPLGVTPGVIGLVATLTVIGAMLRPISNTERSVVAGISMAVMLYSALLGPSVAGLAALIGIAPILAFERRYLRQGVGRLLVATGTALASSCVLTLISGYELPLHEVILDPWAIVRGATAAIAVIVTAHLLRGLPDTLWQIDLRDYVLVALPVTAILAAALFVAIQEPSALSHGAGVALLLALVLGPLLISRRRRSAEQAVERLVAAMDQRHPDTLAHSTRVFSMVAQMVDKVEDLPQTDREAILMAALIHDIGKVATPIQTLNKPGSLTEVERNEIKRHAAIGEEIVLRTGRLEATAPIVRSHHERWDGAGYPDGLSGQVIPFGARLIAVADCFDAMTHDRVYRQALSRDVAVAEVLAQSGRQFDPNVVTIFSRIVADQAELDGTVVRRRAAS